MSRTRIRRKVTQLITTKAMIITKDILAERFEEYNKLYFDDELPTPDFFSAEVILQAGYVSLH